MDISNYMTVYSQSDVIRYTPSHHDTSHLHHRSITTLQRPLLINPRFTLVVCAHLTITVNTFESTIVDIYVLIINET